ncbi:MAG: hypothetical protein ACJAYC_002596 [Halieaceae bacterium]|jgi:uncharacterized protein YgfB (UPF0149 family)
MFDDRPGETQVFDFDEMANQLLEQGLSVSPSEIHGCLTGLLGAGQTAGGEQGLSGLWSALEVDLHGELAERALQLYSVTLAALNDDEFDFHPLLPDDEVEIAVRTEALAGWCRGFVSGFGHGKLAARTTGGQVPADSAEALRDFGNIAQAGLDDDASEEELETSYNEIIEYVRFAALNVFMDARIDEKQEIEPERRH